MIIIIKLNSKNCNRILGYFVTVILAFPTTQLFFFFFLGQYKPTLKFVNQKCDAEVKLNAY